MRMSNCYKHGQLLKPSLPTVVRQVPLFNLILSIIFTIIWFWIGERRDLSCEMNCMWIGKKIGCWLLHIHTYHCLCPLKYLYCHNFVPYAFSLWSIMLTCTQKEQLHLHTAEQKPFYIISSHINLKSLIWFEIKYPLHRAPILEFFL